MNKRAIIFGLKSFKMTKNEKALFKNFTPWGIILFRRNIKNLIQLKNLTNEIKIFFKDKNYPILIDEEGGKVCRLNNIFDLSSLSQAYFGKIYKKNKKNFYQYYKIYIDSVSQLFKYLGININTVPVLDIRRVKSHNIIGNRSFSKNANEVSILGNFCTKLYKKNKIATVVKHIPGHGLSTFDSHYKTPVINNKKKYLIKNDFKAFKKNNSLFAMTAHIIYRKYDATNPATHSNIIIKKIIRNHIKFKGILISDDISMKALKFSIEVNAIKSLKAGCNLVLHCNGNIKEMSKLANLIPYIDKFTEKKTSDFYKFLG